MHVNPLADKTTYIPRFVKANLLKLSPFAPKTQNQMLLAKTNIPLAGRDSEAE